MKILGVVRMVRVEDYKIEQCRHACEPQACLLYQISVHLVYLSSAFHGFLRQRCSISCR